MTDIGHAPDPSFLDADFRLGSFSEVGGPIREVRSCPDNGHMTTASAGPKSAISGSRRVVMHRDYSGKAAFMWASRIFIRISGERSPSSSSMAELFNAGIMRKESALTRRASAILPAPT
jgi:hypothetical protein